ncbi:hypothetical protein [cf. Phormidesmis sp. LEGE 11477]|uniref:hypothetical protein n=1 Tax=cf. Phormidesmis sp. LEGE 11477 TaxID=1828680 RepID=UPI0018808CD6|nr:hypothetical protein [cf. Phormidesmis sp. LEGE 11477]MBE9062405.1 hypothetical protein [cf. Phormidesmis sp. LEGE 11477]
MYEQVENSKENKSKAVGNSVGQRKNNTKQGFVDNRGVTIGQRKLRESLEAKNVAQLRRVAVTYDSFTVVGYDTENLTKKQIQNIIDDPRADVDSKVELKQALNKGDYLGGISTTPDKEKEAVLREDVVVDESETWEKQFNEKTCWLAAIAVATDSNLMALKAKLEKYWNWKDKDFYGVGSAEEMLEVSKMLGFTKSEKIDIDQETFNSAIQIGCKICILVPDHVMIVHSITEAKYSVWDPFNKTKQTISWETLKKSTLSALLIM